jgi:sporulation protein YlmC with PRC-barrel domain
MIRASELRGRPIVDLGSAVKLGDVDEVALDPDSRRVAGLVIGRGRPLLGGGVQDRFVPASAVHAIGGDVVTVRGGAEPSGVDLTGFPRLGQIVGRKVVTHAGAVLGPIDDVLIDPADGRIVGYTLSGSALGGLGKLFGDRGSEEHDYVRADADLRVGPELVVVPDDALVRATAEEQPARGRASPESVAPTVFTWPDPEPRPSGSSWIDDLSHAPMPGAKTATPAPTTGPPAAEPAPGDPLAATQVIDLSDEDRPTRPTQPETGP